MTQIAIHNCTGIKVWSHHPSNANSITLHVETKTGCEVDGEWVRGFKCCESITLYDLPEHVTEALLEAIGPADHVFRPTGADTLFEIEQGEK